MTITPKLELESVMSSRRYRTIELFYAFITFEEIDMTGYHLGTMYHLPYELGQTI
jgi:hypothetical protein